MELAQKAKIEKAEVKKAQMAEQAKVKAKKAKAEEAAKPWAVAPASPRGPAAARFPGCCLPPKLISDDDVY